MSMSTTIEHRAMTRRERETHLQLARETGHAKALAMLGEPSEQERAEFFAEAGISSAIMDAAAVLGRDAATRLAMTAVLELQMRRS
jgi:hypothetical protein